MINIQLTNEQARVLRDAVGTASHCYAEFPELADKIKLLERVAKSITDQLPDAGPLAADCKVKYSLMPDNPNHEKRNRV